MIPKNYQYYSTNKVLQTNLIQISFARRSHAPRKLLIHPNNGVRFSGLKIFFVCPEIAQSTPGSPICSLLEKITQIILPIPGILQRKPMGHRDRGPSERPAGQPDPRPPPAVRGPRHLPRPMALPWPHTLSSGLCTPGSF